MTRQYTVPDCRRHTGRVFVSSVEDQPGQGVQSFMAMSNAARGGRRRQPVYTFILISKYLV
jgi:hypothetical protein